MWELGLGVFGLGDASLYKEIRSGQRDVRAGPSAEMCCSASQPSIGETGRASMESKGVLG